MFGRFSFQWIFMSCLLFSNCGLDCISSGRSTIPFRERSGMKSLKSRRQTRRRNLGSLNSASKSILDIQFFWPLTCDGINHCWNIFALRHLVNLEREALDNGLIPAPNQVPGAHAYWNISISSFCFLMETIFRLIGSVQMMCCQRSSLFISCRYCESSDFNPLILLL